MHVTRDGGRDERESAFTVIIRMGIRPDTRLSARTREQVRLIGI